MSPTFSEATWGHSYKLSLLLHLLNAKGSTIAHSGSDSINKLDEDIFQRAGVWNITLDSLSSISFLIDLLFTSSLSFANVCT